MDILSSLSSNDHSKKPGDDQKARIKAKIDLWTFLDENISAIINTYLDENELAQEIINTAIWILHPHYEGKELIREVQFVLRALKLKQPDNYLQVFRVSYQRIVVKKMTQTIAHNKRDK
jgi:hypothetical protein